MFYKRQEEPGEVMDRNQLLNLLVEYYDTCSLELQAKIAACLESKDSIHPVRTSLR